MKKELKMSEGLEPFSKPPVEEMGMGVVFHSLNKLSGPFYGLFWQSIREQYPELSARLARPAMIEGTDDPLLPTSLIFAGTELPQRYSFSDSSRQNSVGLQRDVLARTWTRRRPDEAYPEYRAQLRGEFSTLWGQFQEFVSTSSLGELRIRQCEVTYTDLIPVGQGWDDLSQVGNVFKPWRGCTDAGLPVPDGITIQSSYPMEDVEGHVLLTMNRAKRIWDKAECLAFTFSARVLAGNEEPEHALKFLDVAHGWAVRIFDAVMSADVRAYWR